MEINTEQGKTARKLRTFTSLEIFAASCRAPKSASDAVLAANGSAVTMTETIVALIAANQVCLELGICTADDFYEK